MKLPKIFVPERNLEKKVNDLLKEDYKRDYSENPSLAEINERIAPIFENFEKIIRGKESQNRIQLESIPDNYRGWIDFFDTEYGPFREYYCIMFDLQSEGGRRLQEIFSNSQRGYRTSQREYHTYHFEPNSSFKVKGILVKKGYVNDFKWYILRIYKKWN